MGRTCILFLVFNGQRTCGNIPVKNGEINFGQTRQTWKKQHKFRIKSWSWISKLWYKAMGKICRHKQRTKTHKKRKGFFGVRKNAVNIVKTGTNLSNVNSESIKDNLVNGSPS